MSTDVAALQAEVSQLKFLLAQAPMIDMFAPDAEGVARLQSARSRFAYVHPKTFAPFVRLGPPNRVYKFPGSPTIWVPLSTIPEGRVLFSPLQVPGLEKVLAG